ncbi:uncharacterized protein LOC143922039 [Arctopsyche grandis]|uniref:uncharacterized protein LOC143922039 n=1 Tax=Arctopsyche grandis TaxID=121162 RepID=UPI00406D8C05
MLLSGANRTFGGNSTFVAGPDRPGEGSDEDAAMAASLRPDEPPEVGDVATGRVHEVRREWIVRTDEQFARRVQDDEIVHHLNDNRNRNEQIREDFPTAAAVQAKQDNIARIEQQIRQQLVDDDAKLARELHSVLSHESKKNSSRKASKTPKNIVNSNVSHKHGSSINGVINEFSEPVASSSKATKSSKRSSNQRHSHPEESIRSKVLSNNMEASSSSFDECFEELTEIGRALGEPSDVLIKEKERLLQEEKDAEMARNLESGSEEIESRDLILAQILQEKEYERANRHQKTHSVVVPDTYSVPRDLVRGGNNSNKYSNDVGLSENMDNNDPQYMEPIHNMKSSKHSNSENHKKPKKHTKAPKLPLRSAFCEQQSIHNFENDYSEDPHYMEVLADESVVLESANGVNISRSLHRMPPETPQITGRPRLEEPIPPPSMPGKILKKHFFLLRIITIYWNHLRFANNIL